MDVMISPQAEREAAWMQANHEELTERLARALREDGTKEPFPGLHLARRSSPRKPLHSVLEPSFCVIAQGSKEVLLGGRRFRFDPSQYLLATVELPCAVQVLEASKERPYLSLRLELAPTVVSSVLLEAGSAQPRNPAEERAIAVSPLDGNLLDAMVRVARLLETPNEARVLLPLVTREIIYRLLQGEQGPLLRHLAVLGGYSPAITRAIDWQTQPNLFLAQRERCPSCPLLCLW